MMDQNYKLPYPSKFVQLSQVLRVESAISPVKEKLQERILLSISEQNNY